MFCSIFWEDDPTIASKANDRDSSQVTHLLLLFYSLNSFLICGFQLLTVNLLNWAFLKLLSVSLTKAVQILPEKHLILS